MKTIDEDIRSGNLKQIYLLYGTEDYLKRQYRDKLKNALTAAGEDSGMGGRLSGGDGDMILTASRERTSTRSRLLILRSPFRFLRSAESFLSRTAVFSKMPAMNLRSIWHSPLQAPISCLWRRKWTSVPRCTRQSRTPEK